MSWECACGTVNNDSNLKCNGCGWTKEQLHQYLEAPPKKEQNSFIEIRIEDIEIYAGGITRPHKVIGEIMARVGAAHLFSKTPTIEDVNFKLREVALKNRANAIINVTYDRGISATSWKALTARGIAVFVESEDVKCPFCAELIKREAKKCKHCGSMLS